MKKFDVVISEYLEKTISIEAENEYEALKLAEQTWKNGEVVLDSSNFTGVEFDVVNDINETEDK